MRPLALLFIATLIAFPLTGCQTLSDNLLWKHEEADVSKKKRQTVAPDEVSPEGLALTRINPITKEKARQNALSRPKIVHIDELTGAGSAGTVKYFDVIEEDAITPVPTIDENGRAVRAIIYDNNAIAKEYRLPLDVAWERAIEALLTMPLATVDRSSGIVTTAWNYDQRANVGLLGVVGASMGTRIRYKYTIRFLKIGGLTHIMVIPFANKLEGTGGWRSAKPSLLVTERMFERIDVELMVPIPHK